MHQHVQDPHVLRFADFIRNPHHPCAMAKSVITREAAEFGRYAGLEDADSARRLCEDLYHSLTKVRGGPWSYVAMFPGERVAGEEDFEARLWSFLQRMHDYDVQRHGWDQSVSCDPEDATFSFSIGGRAWYVIGMHPQASRRARQLPIVALVFNPHAQFEWLRASGRYRVVRDQIRRRDIKLQGSVNPMLADHGTASEARQYSGRAVGDSWKCPFRARG